MDFLQRLFFALVVGSFIGLEREYHKEKVGLGLRTTALVSILGALNALFVLQYKLESLVWVSLLGVTGLSISLFWYRTRKSSLVGLTSSVTLLLAFLLGFMSGLGLIYEAVITSIIAFTLLFFKSMLTTTVRHMTREEIIDALQFAVLAFIVYPLIPQGEFLFVNLRKVWEGVLIVSGISFLGFIAIRKLGARGILLSSLVSGFVSSKATIVSIIDRYKKNKRMESAFASGIMMALIATLLGNFLIAFFLSRSLSLLLPFAEFIAVSLLYGAFILVMFLRKTPEKMSHKVKLETPFAVKPALMFGMVFFFVFLLSKLGTLYFGDSGFIVVSFITGLVSSTSVAASSSLLFLDGAVSLEMFVMSIVLASVSSMLSTIPMIHIFKGGGLLKKTGMYIAVLILLLLGVLVYVL